MKFGPRVQLNFWSMIYLYSDTPWPFTSLCRLQSELSRVGEDPFHGILIHSTIKTATVYLESIT